MSIREAFHSIGRGWRVYNIGFNDVDETQFTASGIRDLEDLWIRFCAEEKIDINCVDYVELA